MHLIDPTMLTSALKTFKLDEELLCPKRLDPAWLLALETAIFSAVLVVGKTLLSSILEQLHQKHAWVGETLNHARQAQPNPWRSHTRRPVTVATLFGKIKVTSSYWVRDSTHKRGPKRKHRGSSGGGLYPVLHALGIEDKATPALQSEVARQSVLSNSFAEAQATLQARGIQLGLKPIRRITYSLAERARRWQAEVISGQQQVEQPRLFAGRRVFFGSDGGRYLERLPHRQGRRRANGRRGYITRWREPRMIVIEVLDEKGHRDRNIAPIYLTTNGDADEVMRLLQGMLRAYGIAEAAQVIVAADGANWFWDRLPALFKALQLDDERVVEVLDFYHALNHLSYLMEIGDFTNTKQARRWYREQRQRLKSLNKWHEFIAAIEELPLDENAAIGDKCAEQIWERERQFFKNHAARMRYAFFKQHHIPRGSGTIESAVRLVINLRVKASSKAWKEANCEAMLLLRSHLMARRWDEMIRGIFGIPCTFTQLTEAAVHNETINNNSYALVA